MKFSKTVSKQPRKKRAAMYSATFALLRKKVRAHLSKDLKAKLGTRSVVVKKGDKVKVTTGKHKGKEAKVSSVNYSYARVFLEGIVQSKQAGKEVLVPFDASNLMIVETAREKKDGRKKAAQAAKK